MRGMHVASVDIGKTNKRVVVFDPDLNPVAEQRASIDEIEGPGGVREENINALNEFVDGALAALARSHPIGAIGISTHAGTWVGLDNAGRRCLPVIAYTNDPGAALVDDLLARMGGEAAIYLATGTPRLPACANMGLGVAFAARRFLAAFARTALILNLPQYLGYRLTGVAAVERTYLGCYTYLWDVAADRYSDLAGVVGYRERAPGAPAPTRGLTRPIDSTCAKRLGLDRSVVVHLGVHDSNAALATAMGTGAERSAMLSTGTWSVAMVPGAAHLEANDRTRGILLNIDVDGRPVRTSTYKAGALYSELCASVQATGSGHSRHNDGGGGGTIDAPRVLVPQEPVAGRVMVEVAPGRCLEWDEALEVTAGHADFERMWLEALGQGFAAKAWQQLEAVGAGTRARIVVEGGFSRNRFLMATLEAIAGDGAVVAAPDDLGSTRGAAMLALGLASRTGRMNDE